MASTNFTDGKDFSARLRTALKGRDVTAAWLSREAGLNEGQLSQALSGKKALGRASAAKAAVALQVPVAWLYFGEGDEPIFTNGNAAADQSGRGERDHSNPEQSFLEDGRALEMLRSGREGQVVETFLSELSLEELTKLLAILKKKMKEDESPNRLVVMVLTEIERRVPNP